MIRCWLPFSSVMVQRNGIVLACCYNRIPMGNLNNQTIEEIWHGAMFQKLRESILDGTLDCGCTKDCPNVVRSKE